MKNRFMGAAHEYNLLSIFFLFLLEHCSSNEIITNKQK